MSSSTTALAVGGVSLRPSIRHPAYFLARSLPAPVCPVPQADLGPLGTELDALGSRLEAAEDAVNELRASVEALWVSGTCAADDLAEDGQTSVAPPPAVELEEPTWLKEIVIGVAGLLEATLGAVLCSRRHGAGRDGSRAAVPREVADAEVGGRLRRRGAGVLR